MLRPDWLLPPKRLLSPRSGTVVSLRYLGPATRRSGAYRDGTLTRWRSAARKRQLILTLAVCFTTHHRGGFYSAGIELTTGRPLESI